MRHQARPCWACFIMTDKYGFESSEVSCDGAFSDVCEYEGLPPCVNCVPGEAVALSVLLFGTSAISRMLDLRALTERHLVSRQTDREAIGSA